MSKLSDYAENLLADFWRDQPFGVAADFTVALVSIAADTGATKLTGTGYADLTVTRSLANFAGTQAPASTLASSGSSHRTSNNGTWDFGTVGAGGWGTMNAVALYDGPNLFAWAPCDARTLIEGDSISFDPGTVVFTLGLSGGMSDYLSNRLIDMIFRGQAFSMPANTYAAYTTTTPTNSTPGLEPGVGGYARVPIPSSLAGWGPTQGDLSTDLSTGTSGRISNRSEIAFPEPTAPQGIATHAELWDAASGGNFLCWRAFATARTIQPGGATPPRFQPDAFGITFA